MGYMFLPYKRMFDFSGRSRPMEYWLYILFYLIQIAVATIIDIQLLGADYTSYAEFGDGGFSASFNMNLGIASIVVLLVNLVPALSVSVRRAHDSDWRGWWILVPLFNFILMCFPGTPGPNRFGPDPKAPPASQIFS